MERSSSLPGLGDPASEDTPAVTQSSRHPNQRDRLHSPLLQHRLQLAFPRPLLAQRARRSLGDLLDCLRIEQRRSCGPADQEQRRVVGGPTRLDSLRHARGAVVSHQHAQSLDGIGDFTTLSVDDVEQLLRRA